MTDALPPLPGHACQVFRAEDVYVVLGVNHGDALAGAEDVPGDIYHLDPDARALRLVIAGTGEGATPRVGDNSTVGRPGEAMVLTARYRLMAEGGETVDLLLIALDGGERLVLPLSPMAAGEDYTLLRVDPADAEARLTDLLCVSFARGTMITLAGGAQRAIETLAPGDRILTRDHGAQPLRWIGRATLRAVGAFAPVVITAGTLGNEGDLIVSPHHRIFLYQRRRAEGQRTSELLVQAKHLVDDTHVFVREGGFVDYFSLVFDHHEIVYAEGIPAESLMVNDATLSRLPPDLADEVRARFPGLSQSQHFGTEAGRHFLDDLPRPARRG